MNRKTFPDGTEIKAIPTTYKGVQLKSRMEAQCAVLFDKLGWIWEYESLSLMLPSGLAYLPDFWLPDPYIIAECRGYESNKGTRQIDEFADLIESGFELPDKTGMVSGYLAIGPDSVKYHAIGNPNGKPSSKRELYESTPGIIGRCMCGWRMLALPYLACPNCNTAAIAYVCLSIHAGKLYANGYRIEEFSVPAYPSELINWPEGWPKSLTSEKVMRMLYEVAGVKLSGFTKRYLPDEDFQKIRAVLTGFMTHPDYDDSKIEHFLENSLRSEGIEF